MIMKKLFVVLIAVLMGLTLIGCGAKNNGGSPQAGSDAKKLAEEMVGHYGLSWTEGDTTSEEDVKIVNQAGIEFSLTINEDGSAVLVSNGAETDLTCDFEKLEFKSGLEVIKFTYDNGTVRLTEGDNKITFVKSEE